jgi:CSLREA domain-containing protein
MLSTSGRRRIGGALALTLLLCGPTAAATIVVDSTADDFDGAPNGNCTLREAIVAANTNAAVDGCPAGGPGPGVVDLVQVPAGLFVLSIGGAGENQSATGDLDLTDDVIISGAGAPLTVVDADGIDRVFDVADVQAELSGLTLRNGHAGGGNGGAIENGGELMVEFCAIESSFAGGPGGGVRNDNDITLASSVLSGNTSADHRKAVVLCLRPGHRVLRHAKVGIEFVFAVCGLACVAESLHRPMHSVPDERWR